MKCDSRSLLVGFLLLIGIAGLSVVATGNVAAQQVDVAASDLDGSGTQDDPYLITNASELQAIEDDTDAHYELGNDIDASNTAQWNPVGNSYEDSYYYGGVFSGLSPGDKRVELSYKPVGNATEVEIRADGSLIDSGGDNFNLTDEKTVVFDDTISETYGIEDSETNQISFIYNSSDYKGFSTIDSFVGVLNGNGNTISNIHIYRQDQVQNIEYTAKNGGYTGVFAQMGGKIKKLELSNISVRSPGQTGGLVGDLTGSGDITITNVSVSGRVTSTQIKGISARYTGGIVARQFGPNITRSKFSGSVRGGESVGGIVGVQREGIIQLSYSNAEVFGDERVGGLAGALDLNGQSVIKKSWAEGTVHGSRTTGGLVGIGGQDGTYINKSFAVVQVDAPGSRVGGLKGGDLRGTIVTDSYWDVNISGQSSSSGGTGLDTSKMTGKAASDSLSGLDFNSVWKTQPNDYPVLRWQTTDDDSDNGSGSSGDSTSSPVVAEDTVFLSGSTITVNTSRASAVAVLNLSKSVGVSNISDSGSFDPNGREILYSNLGGELPENVTFRLDPDDSTYTAGDTLTFTVDRTQVTLTVSTVPPELQGDVTGEQYTAVLDGDNALGASNLADAINQWVETGTVNGTEIGAAELSQLINYWADS